MEPVPGESQAKKEMIEKNIMELLQLKEAVALKRRQLKAMGLNDEPELKSKLIKYPDLQAKYKQAKQAKLEPLLRKKNLRFQNHEGLHFS
jgi:hypothetical protein